MSHFRLNDSATNVEIAIVYWRAIWIRVAEFIKIAQHESIIQSDVCVNMNPQPVIYSLYSLIMFSYIWHCLRFSSGFAYGYLIR